jgi:protein-S-isoprenylcysteine O-methyltransferase Ste14
VVFVVLNPGLMGGVVPWLLTHWHSHHPPVAMQLLGGALIVAGAFWLLVASFVYLHEEPSLSERYGEQYATYRRSLGGRAFGGGRAPRRSPRSTRDEERPYLRRGT